MNTVGIRLEGVAKRFGNVVAVQQVNLELPAGKLTTLLGPSGCGKTTILRMVAGLEAPSSGEIWFGQEKVTRLPAYLRDVTMMFQSYALFPHMNVRQNIGYGLQVTRRPTAETAQRVAEVVKKMGLQGLEDRPVAALSGGQQQRVALARSLVMEPRILLFDEPLSNLDAKLRKRVREEIRDLQQELGITSLYVTHDQEEAMAISDLVVLMEKGQIAQQGTPRELYTHPTARFVAEFIGQANFLPAHSTGGQLTVGRYTLNHNQPQIQGPCTLMVRPEAVRLSPSGEGMASTVHSVAYLGSVTEVRFDSEVGRIEGNFPGDLAQPLQRGSAVWLQFSAQGIHLLP